MNNTTDRLLADHAPGDAVSGFFVLRSVELKTKRDGKPYVTLNVGDASGRLPANLWDDAQRFYEEYQAGDIVKIQGKVTTYRDSPQLAIDKIRKAEPADGVSPQDFVAQAPIDIDQAFSRLMDLIGTLQDGDITRLLRRVFSDEKTVAGFKAAPGGKLWHHAYRGGLLEHTLNVAAVCETVAGLYGDVVDRDLLLAGALLHDIGKLEEYDFDGGFIDFTDPGRLMGHITLGAQRVRGEIEALEKEGGFDPELKQLLLHLILSHQGKREQGSPVEPAVPEAMILYYADELDSKANALRRIIQRDAGPGRRWSQFIQLLDRYIYMRQPRQEGATTTEDEDIPPSPVPPIPSEPPRPGPQSTLFD